MMDHPPFQHIYDLADLSAGGAEVMLSASASQLGSLADWLGVVSVQEFSAIVNLKRLAMNRYRYDADLVCSLTQASVVSLVPVHTRIEQTVSRELHVAYHSRHDALKSQEVTLAAAEDEAPEEIPSSRYDLAGPLLEELALALDPYPRAPGEVFSPPEDTEVPPESPFAVLKKLRDGG